MNKDNKIGTKDIMPVAVVNDSLNNLELKEKIEQLKESHMNLSLALRSSVIGSDFKKATEIASNTIKSINQILLTNKTYPIQKPSVLEVASLSKDFTAPDIVTIPTIAPNITATNLAQMTIDIKPLLNIVGQAIAPMKEFIQNIGNTIKSINDKVAIEIQHFSSIANKLAQSDTVIKMLNFYNEEGKYILRAYEYAHDELKFMPNYSLFNTFHLAIKSGIKAKTPKRTLVNQLLSLSRKSDFRTLLIEDLESSSLSVKRRKIIMDVYECHCNRIYTVSIPMFLIQIEALLTEYLLRIGKAKKENGSIVKTKNGQPYKGLSDKIKTIPNDSILDNEETSHLKTRVPSFRNEVLHGNTSSYTKPLYSLQLLIIMVHLFLILQDDRKIN